MEYRTDIDTPLTGEMLVRLFNFIFREPAEPDVPLSFDPDDYPVNTVADHDEGGG